eukprot:TRINITY_DN17856_c0_g4_i1.p1 TRINITY_DN17856_c0_g4~~TRINITY_DN17856_c0_g4_i1.p1  ORF type:complete len:338 (-),score=73.41 TRINITY_DN17856_c0_g4_i1:146-1159(-)
MALLTNGVYAVWGRNGHGYCSALEAFDASVFIHHVTSSALTPPLSHDYLPPPEARQETLEMMRAAAAERLAVDSRANSPRFTPEPKKKRRDWGKAIGESRKKEEVKREKTPPKKLTKEELERERRKQIRKNAKRAYDPEACRVAEENWMAMALVRNVGQHCNIHGKAKQIGRAYAMIWQNWRRRQEELFEAAIESGEIPANSTIKQMDHDENSILDFHLLLIRDIEQFHTDECIPGGAQQFGWSEEAFNVHFGVIAVDKAIRAVSKAITGDENLFGEPPPCFDPNRRGPGPTMTWPTLRLPPIVQLPPSEIPSEASSEIFDPTLDPGRSLTNSSAAD